MSNIIIPRDKDQSLNRAHAMTPELMKANEDWNKFVEKNRGWIAEYRTRMQNITEDKLTVDTVIKERLTECFEENQPLSGEFLRLRKALLEPQSLGRYKQNLDRMTQIEAPAPYWRDLVVDEDVRADIDQAKRKMGVKK